MHKFIGFLPEAFDPVIESTGGDSVFLAPGLVAEAAGTAFPNQVYPFAFTAFWLFLYHSNPTPIFYFRVCLHCGAGRAGSGLYQTAPNSTPGTGGIGSTPSWIDCLTKSRGVERPVIHRLLCQKNYLRLRRTIWHLLPFS